jgi:hypothetical protein
MNRRRRWNAKAAKAAKKSILTLHPWRPLRSIVMFSLATRITQNSRSPQRKPVLFCEFCGSALNVVPCGGVKPIHAPPLWPSCDPAARC